MFCTFSWSWDARLRGKRSAGVVTLEGRRMSVMVEASSACTVLTEHYGFREQMEAQLDPITDIFRTMHVTAFGQHRLEATAPWGLIQEKRTEEKVTPSGKKNP